MYNTLDGRLTHRLSVPSGNNWSFGLNRAGTRLATLASDEKVHIWNVETGEALAESTIPVGGNVKGVGFDPNDRLITCATDRGCKIWEGNRVVHTLTEAFNVPVYSRSGDRLAYVERMTSGSTVHVVDTGNWTEIAQLQGIAGSVTGMDFSPDAKWLTIASWDGTVTLWDLTTLQRLRTLENYPAPATSVHFSSDGEYIISSSEDHTVRVTPSDIDDVLLAALQAIEQPDRFFELEEPVE